MARVSLLACRMGYECLLMPSLVRLGGVCLSWAMSAGYCQRPPPPFLRPTGMHGAGMWGAVGHTFTVTCIQCVSCCTVVGYSEKEPWGVVGALSIWVVMSPSGAAWLQGSDYEHMVAVW